MTPTGSALPADHDGKIDATAEGGAQSDALPADLARAVVNLIDRWPTLSERQRRRHAIVGSKGAKDRLCVLFAGQQYMEIRGRDAEAIWAALCRLSTEADGFGSVGVEEGASTNA